MPARPAQQRIAPSASPLQTVQQAFLKIQTDAYPSFWRTLTKPALPGLGLGNNIPRCLGTLLKASLSHNACTGEQSAGAAESALTSAEGQSAACVERGGKTVGRVAEVQEGRRPGTLRAQLHMEGQLPCAIYIEMEQRAHQWRWRG